MTYHCILTNLGIQKEAAAIAANQPIMLTHMAIGDSNGVELEADPTATSLVNEVRRDQILRKFNPAVGQVSLEMFIPFDVGGWWVREIGIFDEDGDMIAVANVPPSYKPLPGSGAARAMTVRPTFAVTNTGAFASMVIDPSVALVTVESLKAQTDNELMPLILAGL